MEQKVTSCEASQCHEATILGEYPPTGGKHFKHLTNDLACENCHNNYINNILHSNSVLDVDNESIIVEFDDSLSTTVWDNKSGNCSYVGCHGGAPNPVNWYSDLDSDVPNIECTICHSGGSSIDPITTNGTEKNGKHISHVIDAVINCDICHNGYKDQPSHMNGTYGREEISTIIYFNPISNPSAIWDDSSTTCSNMNCHGNVSWYTDEPMTCAFCHAPGTGIDPEATGSHSRHLAAGYDCAECHEDYLDKSSHSNGVKENASNAPGMINFSNSHNPDGTYNPSVLSCSDLYCHGSFPLVNYDGNDINPGNNFSPIWGTGSAGAACGSCHGNADNNYSSATHGSHTDSNAEPVIFNNESKIESCDACHNYGDDDTRTFGLDNTQGSYYSDFHANFSINDSGINSDVSFKPDNTNLASKISPDTLVIDHTTWNEATASCSDSWCHGNFTDGSSIIGYNATPSWLIPSTGACGTCHENSHFGYNNQCMSCHSGHGMSMSTPYHIDGNIGIQ